MAVRVGRADAARWWQRRRPAKGELDVRKQAGSRWGMSGGVLVLVLVTVVMDTATSTKVKQSLLAARSSCFAMKTARGVV